MLVSGVMYGATSAIVFCNRLGRVSAGSTESASWQWALYTVAAVAVIVGAGMGIKGELSDD